jgi:hypothetical protein
MEAAKTMGQQPTTPHHHTEAMNRDTNTTTSTMARHQVDHAARNGRTRGTSAAGPSDIGKLPPPSFHLRTGGPGGWIWVLTTIAAGNFA